MEIKIKFLSDSKCHTSVGGERLSLIHDIFLYCLPSKLTSVSPLSPGDSPTWLLKTVVHTSSGQVNSLARVSPSAVGA